MWAFFAGCIVAIPLAVWRGELRVALVLIAVVALEVVILALNGMRCPLTGVAARYTDDRRDNFDIFLPLSIARYNKQIFGTLYALGVLYAALQWWSTRA